MAEQLPASYCEKKKRGKGPMVRPHAYLNGGVTHPVQQAQWPFFNTACSLPLFTGTPNANANAGGNKSDLVGMRNTE